MIATSARQLTIRAAIAGMLLGGFMSLSNLYTALKIGWSFGVAITAGVLAWGIFALFQRLGLIKTAFGILENNAMQSVASCAGYMVGGGTVAAIPAMMMLTGQELEPLQMFGWISSIALLGVVMAIPMKQQMINIEQLRFPSGIAAAETLRALHGGEEGKRQGRMLGRGAILGTLVAFAREAKASWIPWNLAESLPFALGAPLLLLPKVAQEWVRGKLSAGTVALLDAQPKLRGRPLSDYTFSLDTSIILVAAGMIMGWRPAWSMMLGAVVNYLVLVPQVYARGIVDDRLGYKFIVQWSVWFGSAMMLTSGLVAFAFQWRSVVNAMKSVAGAFGKQVKSADEEKEVPMLWFIVGVAICGPLVVALEYLVFGIKPWLGVISVILSFFIAIVACRVTGETDTTPSGALGKITQVTFGVLDPGNTTTNLMTANATGGVGLHAADLLTDLKSGYILKADPRQQFWAQLLGVIAGSLFVVPAWALLVEGPEDFGTKWPVPAAQSWKGVAVMLAQGISNLHPTAQACILVGGGLGIVMVLAEKYIPAVRPYMPSAAGLGLGFTTPGSNTISMFIGAAIALYLTRKDPKAEEAIIPASSGALAGESLSAVFIRLLGVAGLFGH